jgi:hypothetical protein
MSLRTFFDPPELDDIRTVADSRGEYAVHSANLSEPILVCSNVVPKYDS